MTTMTDIAPGETIDLSSGTVGIDRATGRVRRIIQARPGPPQRIDGYSVGAPFLTSDAPHDGEMHPDADELLYLVSGRIQVVLELEEGHKTVDVLAGQALVVPRGVWHKITLQEPGRLIHITPGPGGEHRPLTSRNA